MRRVVSSVTVALGLFGATVALAGVAVAAPAPASSEPPAAKPGKKVCTAADERLRELSGLVATKTGFVVINDGTQIEARKRIFFLDAKCKIAKTPLQYSGQGPFDTEDLALSKDGKTLWVADTGDNVTAKERRKNVAVWELPVGGTKQPVLHRLSYPEGKPHDAEALLIGDDGKPLIITKVTSGKAEIYTPTRALKKSGDPEAVPMSKVGEIALPKTQTENPLATFGRVSITGAARSPDGSRVVVRTYADAFEFDVTGGDIVGALTTGKPRVTPLADPFGEAISYTPDGRSFVTVSEVREETSDDPVDILSYTPSTSGAAPVPDEGAAKPAASQSWFDGLSLDDITYLIGAVGAIGLLLVGIGVAGILRARRKPPAADGPGPDEPVDRRGGPAADRFPPAGERPGSGVYGGAPAGGAVYGGVGTGVYGGSGGRGGPAPAGGGVYGGARPAGDGGDRPGAGGAGGAGGSVYGGGRPPAGGGGRPVGGGGGRPAGGGSGRPPANGGRPGGGVYGGGQPGAGRVEPPRRGGPEPDYRAQRPGRRRDDGPVDPYGPGGVRGPQGDRY
ncbi:hypothetical protein ACFOW4_28230 [Micromonospora sp. GCM10011542]|uniref:hypothetical protein n=1 Tax=Micromonospora sp. GCM10011542 TaxID=3317337 RepID=UPI0036231623